MTDDDKPSMERQLAEAAAMTIVASQNPQTLHEFVRKVGSDERYACQVGRAVGASVRAWLARPQG